MTIFSRAMILKGDNILDYAPEAQGAAPWALTWEGENGKPLTDEILSAHFQTWLETDAQFRDAGPWSGEDVDSFLSYLEQFGYGAPVTWDCIWEVPFPKQKEVQHVKK